MKKQTSNWSKWSGIITPFFIVAGLILVALSCQDGKTKKTAVEQGNELFQSYCVICHGKYADGKGNMADMLTTQPMNLTTIAQRRGGAFPADEITQVIAGGREVPGHGPTDMPAWWETLKRSEGISKDKVVDEKIGHIVAYLKAIQK